MFLRLKVSVTERETRYDSLFLEGSHMMLASYKGSDYQFMRFTYSLMKTTGLLFILHKMQTDCRNAL